MALQNSGAISLNQMHVEAGGSSGSQCTINDSDIRDLISKSSGATMSFNEWYGASASEPTQFTISPAFGGVTNWDLASSSNGDLNISAHGEYTITPGADMYVDVKMWGGGGAAGWVYTSSSQTYTRVGYGGGGGQTTARLYLRYGSSYILRIGEGGDPKTFGGTVHGGADYRGGGVSRVYGNVAGYDFGAEGGGYSGIFKTSVSQGNAMMIAGGGGGGGDSAYDGSGAGAGGGSSGQAGGGGAQSGGGGTQSAGGAASIYNNATAGSALTGGIGQSSYPQYFSGGGGGGGYYGGGGGNVGGGGGGSGYVASTDVSGYGSNSGNGTTTAGSYQTPANSSDSDRGNSGDGDYGTGFWLAGPGEDGRIIIKAV